MPTGSELFQQVGSIGNLRIAWNRVEESDGCAGIDGVTLAKYGENLEMELSTLHAELVDGTYQPLPVVRFYVPKRNGGQRPLCVYTVRDRVTQNAVLNIIGSKFEREFESCSYAYRKGRSAQQALAEVERLRDQGFKWVVDADISSYFDNVDHDLLLERVCEVVHDESVLKLIIQWITPIVYDGIKSKRSERGLPQGSPISPVLANLFLDKFDEQMMSEGQKLVRFADDFVVLCKSKPKADDALELTRQTLLALQLALNDEKTRITDFNAGFTFLGATFVRSLCMVPQPGKRDEKDAERQIINMPPPLSMAEIRSIMKAALGESVNEPVIVSTSAQQTLAVDSVQHNLPEPIEPPSEMPPPALHTLRTLYLHEHGTVLRCEDEHLRICKDETELLSLPAFKIDMIILFGNSHITTPAMKFCLKNNIPILLLSSRGEFFGIIESTANQNVLLQQIQFGKLNDESFVIEASRQFVRGKIANSRALLQRRLRSTHNETVAIAIARLEQIGASLASATTVEEIRGYEGAASAQYFKAYGECLHHSFEFNGRNRRPPLDPVNALLSFGYTMTFYNIYAIARGRGLSPYVGMLHSLRQGHPAFCSDLIEEFRSPIVDSLVTALLNKRIMTPADFYFSETSQGVKGCFLTDQARRIFVEQFEHRMNTIVRHPHADIQTTWRGCIDLQIGHFIKVLRGEVAKYIPIEIR